MSDSMATASAVTYGFDWALQHIRTGGKARRPDWGNNTWLVLGGADRLVLGGPSCNSNWTPDARDILATDWHDAAFPKVTQAMAEALGHLTTMAAENGYGVTIKPTWQGREPFWQVTVHSHLSNLTPWNDDVEVRVATASLGAAP